eukprot:TRINITY_DN55545_c0_g1_i1.p1 TRINITY_DN55545_c0_g1~~TRINITY_DN55545_c0_g1_i1.p1  ORF type:complete len:588 (-),score=93.01 TRINITY_DN55545_c0_g1_i1:99-1757(-)
MPACGGEHLLSFDAGYRGSPRRERFYKKTEWAIDLLRRLHSRVMEETVGVDSGKGSLFYIPTFFGLLLAINDGSSLQCAAASCAALTASSAFRRNAGYDHFYLHGLEHPVVAGLDYADGSSRKVDEASSGMIHAVYATLQNVAVVASGDLSQGTMAAAVDGALYGMRRIVTSPFVFHEDCCSGSPTPPISPPAPCENGKVSCAATVKDMNPADRTTPRDGEVVSNGEFHARVGGAAVVGKLTSNGSAGDDRRLRVGGGGIGAAAAGGIVGADTSVSADTGMVGGGKCGHRDVRLTFVGSVQSYNLERALFLQAVQKEFAGIVEQRADGLIVVDDPRLQLRARVQVDPRSAPLNSSERSALAGGRRDRNGGRLQRLYRRSELCVVAPGDAPMLGQRLSDVVAAGCLPVVFCAPGAYPVLPLQGSVRWEEFSLLVRLGDVDDAHALTGARHALRRLLALRPAELARRRSRLLFWRPRLALGAGPKCAALGPVALGWLRPDAADLILQELWDLQPIWQRQLPFGGLSYDASVCGNGSRPLGPRCGALAGFWPDWG